MLTAGKKIAPLRRAEIPELSQFLSAGFGSAASSLFSHEALAWKYFDRSNTSSDESCCSLVARSANKIIGHIGICPRQLVVAGNGTPPVSTMHAIDWFSSPSHRGMGSMLMLQAFKASRTQYTVGATAVAEALFPRLGFEQKPGLAIYRNVLTPFHRLRVAEQGILRRWVGACKDFLSSRRRLPQRSSRVVELRPALTFTDEIDGVFQRSSLRIVTPLRHHPLLNYFLRCPLSGFSGWTIYASQRLIGFAVLRITTHRRIRTGKIVDCWLDSEEPSSWQAAVAALLDQLRSLAADEVICFSNISVLQEALLCNGFAKTGERNVFVRDKERCLPREIPYGFSLLDADAAIV